MKRILFLAGAAALLCAQDTPKPDFADLSYGPSPTNKLDLWLAKSERPAPLLVFIHGGGFVGGDKKGVRGALVQQALAAGASFASINYRFRTEVPIQTVLRDCARALQFLRYNAKKYNLNKSVATFGGSAGAGTSLWLAFHDDMADPNNPDPVLRESTRIAAAAATATQATYDVLKWSDFLGKEVLKFMPESEAPPFYGMKTVEQLHSPEGEKIRADVDMLGLITKDDPPVLMISAADRNDLSVRGNVLHTAQHAIAVKKRCDEVGVPATLAIDKNPNPVEFLLKYVQR